MDSLDIRVVGNFPDGTEACFKAGFETQDLAHTWIRDHRADHPGCSLHVEVAQKGAQVIPELPQPVSPKPGQVIETVQPTPDPAPTETPALELVVEPAPAVEPTTEPAPIEEPNPLGAQVLVEEEANSLASDLLGELAQGV